MRGRRQSRFDDAFGAELLRLGRAPLLTREGEVLLAQRMAAGWAEAVSALFGTHVAAEDALVLGELLAERKVRTRTLLSIPEEADGDAAGGELVRAEALELLTRVRRLEKRHAALVRERDAAVAGRKSELDARIRRSRAEISRSLARVPFNRRAIERMIRMLRARVEQPGVPEGGPAGWREDLRASQRRVERGLEQSERAKHALVESNVRLVISIAKRHRNHGLSPMDLIQEGCLGLMTAAEKFDHARGYKFSTYASWWIRQAITRAIAEKSRIIRLPSHAALELRQIQRAAAGLGQELGRAPQLAELAARAALPAERVEHLLGSREPISIDAPLGEDGETCMGDLIADDRAPDPSVAVATRVRAARVQSLLSVLSERERRVIELRFGLDGRREHTLEEVGHLFAVTRERIRQIEARALSKLQTATRTETLQELLNG